MLVYDTLQVTRYHDLVVLRQFGIIKIAQWDRRESLETQSCIYGHWIEQWKRISFK